MKDKLLKIIDNHIDTVDIINLNLNTTENNPKISINYGYNYPYRGSGEITNLKIALLNDEKVTQEEYNYIIPQPIKDKQNKVIKREDTVNIILYFTDEPPIIINKGYDLSTQSQIITVTKKKKEGIYPFNLFKKVKPQEAILSYTRITPAYHILCGPIKETIDEKTFHDIEKKVMKKHINLSEIAENNKLLKTKEIIENRLNQIKNHQ